MRIVCPSCTAAYEVPDSLVTAGRAVRCARCGEEWVPLTVAPGPVTEPEAPPTMRRSWDDEPEQSRLSAMERLAQSPAVVPRPSVAVRAAWAVSVAVLVLLVWSAYAWRSDVMRIWPPSIRAYDALGVAPPPAR